ncbi:MAG: hypothetical protein NVSMB46_04490 [Candidatus Saccharimonadales bacterium]
MYIILGIIGIYIIGAIAKSIYDKIREEVEKNRSKIRDQVAEDYFSANNITNDDFNELSKQLSVVQQFIPQRLYGRLEPELEEKSALRSREWQLCQKCKVGHFVRRRGRYGEFLGCSFYPNCKNKKPLNWVDKRAKASGKEAIHKQFMEDLQKAYN